MRHIAIALLLLGMSAATAAEHWVVLKTADGAYGYDQESVVDKGKGRFAFKTASYVPEPMTAGSVTYNYLFTDSELNCADKAYTSSAIYLFDDNGEMLDMKERADGPSGADDGGIMEVLSKMVCAHKRFEGTADAGDMDNAMKTMRGYFKK